MLSVFLLLVRLALVLFPNQEKNGPSSVLLGHSIFPRIQKLDWAVAVYIPSALANEAEVLFNSYADRFNGFTCYERGVIGGWRTNERLILENILLLKSYTSKKVLIDNLIPVIEEARLFAKHNGEQAIAIEIFAPRNSFLLIVPSDARSNS